MKVHQIRLELVRTGEAHNQLLSPLTPYIALCGDRPAEIVHVPYVHEEFLELQAALRYENGVDVAQRAAERLAKALREMLHGIGSLREELAIADQTGAAMVELRLVLSAAELSLLPFELMASSSSLPAGLALTSRPMVIIRQSRRTAPSVKSWPDNPRILFVCSDAGGDIPATSHLVGLRAALEPLLPAPTRQWAEKGKGRDARLLDAAAREWFGGHVDVLSGASLDQIRARCERERYTHVHILAHGAELGPTWARRFGLVLRAADGTQREVVHGGKLAKALSRTEGGTLPPVVSIACCDGGNRGSVLTPGGSLAQELHDAGVPVVVASQFPLTFAGSAAMVEAFYTGILRGDEPRVVAVGTRKAMMTAMPGSVDWASFVMYAALPTTFARQVEDARRLVSQRSLDATIARFGVGVDLGGPPLELEPDELPACRAELEKQFDAYKKTARKRLHAAAVARFIASAEKRWAEAVATACFSKKLDDWFAFIKAGARDTTAESALRKDRLIGVALRRSLSFYRQAFLLAPGNPEPLVQTLALSTFLQRPLEAAHIALAAGLLETLPARDVGTSWHRASIELQLIRGPGVDHGLVDELLEGEGGEENAWEGYSLLRQLDRYELFASHDAALIERVSALKEELLRRSVTSTWKPTVMWENSPNREPNTVRLGE